MREVYFPAFLGLVCGIAVAASGSSIDGKAGTRGFKFLQVTPDAQTAALGRASATSGGRVGMVTSNPAGLAELTGFQMMAAYTEWLAAIRQEYLAVAWRQFGGTLAIAARAQSSGDIPLRGIDTGASLVGVPSPQPSGTYGVHDAAFTLAYARSVGSLDWGIGASYVYEKIYFSSASALAFDFGARWRLGRWTAGAALRNVGRSGKMRAERVPLPWDAQAGFMYERPLAGMSFRAMSDVRYAPDWFETLHLGAELQVVRALAVRAGYQTGSLKNSDDIGITVGTGLRYGIFRLDYAYIPVRDGLGSGHTMSLTVGR